MTRQELIELATRIRENKASEKDSALFAQAMNDLLKELRQEIASTQQN